MRVRGSISCLLLLSLWATVAARADPSATAEQLSVRLAVPPAQIYPGQQFKAGLYFKLEPGWHLYSIVPVKGEGPVPTSITVKPPLPLAGQVRHESKWQT